MTNSTYPIGTPGKKWNNNDKAQWLARQNIKRSYQNEVVTLINDLKSTLDIEQYGELNYAAGTYPLYILKTPNFNANKPTVLKEMVSKSKSLTILDLSVPKNVEDELNSFKNIDLLDLDYLSKLTNKTLENRKKFIPNAEKIIKEITEDYYLWVETRKFAPTVNALKIKLKKIQENKINTLKKKTSSFDDTNVKEVSEHLIQKITNQIANHLRDSDDFEEELESIKTIFQLNHNDC